MSTRCRETFSFYVVKLKYIKLCILNPTSEHVYCIRVKSEITTIDVVTTGNTSHCPSPATVSGRIDSITLNHKHKNSTNKSCKLH